MRAYHVRRCPLFLPSQYPLTSKILIRLAVASHVAAAFSHCAATASLPSLQPYLISKSQKHLICNPSLLAILSPPQTMITSTSSFGLYFTRINAGLYYFTTQYYTHRIRLTLFSARCYSHRSLLPMDPAPFTLPSASLSRSKQPFKSPDDYQFPDGTWRWVSKSWMIDMRSDSGEIQYDGFEYNWFFRRHHWRAEVGPLSAGGWVRRRRWIRLMMRPAKHPPPEPFTNHVGSSIDEGNIWKGETLEECWDSCRALMKQLDTDGRKLEVWLSWMDLARTREQMKKLLERHVEQILDMFLYPDSRAQFLAAAERMGASVRRERGVEFWSYHD